MGNRFRPGRLDDVDPIVRDLGALDERVTRLERPDSSQRNLTVEELARAFAAMPVSLRNIDRSSGGSLTAGGWVTVASTSVVVPNGMTLARILALGDGAFLASNNLTSANARILLRSSDGVTADVVSGSFPAAKDAGSSSVNNVLRATFAGNYIRTPGTAIEALFQVQPLNAAAFPASGGNFGQVVLDVNFTPEGIL